jgi:hypothetical protein
MRRVPSAWFLLMLFLWASISSAAFADSFGAEDLALQTMQRFGLVESAIAYATAQRQRVSGDVELYARWTQRLMECEAQAALRSEDSSDKHWQRCAELADTFKREQASNRRLPWIEWQTVRCDLLRSQGLLAQWLAAPARVNVRQQSLELVRKILRDLESLEDNVKERQPLSAKQAPGSKGQASAEQLANLRVDIVLVRCEALLVRSRLYASESRDRIGAATEVSAVAGSVLDSLEVARAAAWLDLGKINEALSILQKYARSADDRQTRIRAATVAIESLLDKGQISQATAFIDLLKASDSGPERYLAEVRLALVELAQLPKAQQEKAMSEIIQVAKTIGVSYGDYWRARAEALIVNSVSSEQLSSSSAVDLITVEVKQLLQAGDSKAAIEKLLQSSRNEQSLRHGENAVRLGLLAALLLEKESQFQFAVEAVETIAAEFPESKSAANAHLQAARILAISLKAEPTNGELRKRYEAMLRRQILLWPDATESSQAIEWLKSWQLARGKLYEMADIFRQQAETSQLPDVVALALDDWLSSVLADHPSPLVAIMEFEKSLTEGKFKMAEPRAQMVWLAANAITTWPSDRQSEQLRSEIKQLLDAPEETVDEQLVAAVLLILAVRNNDATLASQLASQINPSGFMPEVLYGFAKSLLEAIDAQTSNEVPAWTANLLSDSEALSALEKSRQNMRRAVALRWRGFEAGRASSSLQELRALAAKNSKDFALQLQLANVLAATDLRQSSSIANAVAVAVKGRKDNALFLEARWRVLRNQVREGETEAARKAAGLLLATMTIETEIWKSRLSAIAK